MTKSLIIYKLHHSQIMVILPKDQKSTLSKKQTNFNATQNNTFQNMLNFIM